MLQQLRDLLRPRTRWQEFERLRRARAALRNKGFKPEDALVICGDPRGGTTWLMELLALTPRTAVIWEPLHPQRGVVPKHFRLGWRGHIPETVPEPRIQSFIRDVLSGRRINAWTRYSSHDGDEARAVHLLVKFCYASDLLPWMTRWIDFSHKPIHLLRHPVAVALSQVRLFKMHGPLPRIEVPDEIHNDMHVQHVDYLRTLDSHLQLMVAYWCMANKRTLEHTGNRRWCTVYYEHLLLHPERELDRIATETGMTIAPQAYARVREASATVRGTDLEKDPRKQMTKWRTQVPPAELAALQSVLDHFGITVYRCDAPGPIAPSGPE